MCNCSCWSMGLAVGTPIALLVSNSKLAKNGIIVKGGIQIENIKNSGTIVFERTGTLTIGRPTVNQIISFIPISINTLTINF
jgi:cation transport ATPase